MRRFLAVCILTLSCATVAVAQGNSLTAAANGPASSSPAAPARMASEYFNWQVAISYQYFRASAGGTTVNLHGFNTSFTRFATEWIGLEGDVAAGFGDAPDGSRVKLLFYGAGPRIAYRRAEKIEPWGHALFGGTHLLPQTSFGSTNGFGYVVGGGVDYKLTPRVSWRVQGDFVGTHFFSQWQKNGQFVTGLVFNF